MTPELPGAPSSFPNMTPYLGSATPQKPTQACPLVETGGEYRPTQVKQDLGSYTDDSGKCIDTFPTYYLGLWLDVEGHYGHI